MTCRQRWKFGSIFAAVMFAASTAPQTASAGDDSDSGKSYYSTLNCSQLWHERNAVFARQGHCFKEPRSISVFGKGCRPPFGKLESHHRAVVDEIISWERRRGCDQGEASQTPAKAEKADESASRSQGDLLEVRIAGCCLVSFAPGWAIRNEARKKSISVAESGVGPYAIPFDASLRIDGTLVASVLISRVKGDKLPSQEQLAAFGDAQLAKLDASYRQEIQSDITASLFGSKFSDMVGAQKVEAGQYTLILTSYVQDFSSGSRFTKRRYRFLDAGRSFDISLSVAPDHEQQMSAVLESINIQPGDTQ